MTTSMALSTSGRAGAAARAAALRATRRGARPARADPLRLPAPPAAAAHRRRAHAAAAAPPARPLAPPTLRRGSTTALAALASSSDDDDGDGPGGGGEPADVAAARARLLAGAASPASTSITGPELRECVKAKYGKDFAVLLARRGRRVFFQILWKHLEQQSYPQTEEEHAATYDAVASFLSEWGAGQTVRAGIAAASRRGPGFTGGGAARAISIPLDVDLSTARSGEFF